jgi:hypothetical protein
VDFEIVQIDVEISSSSVRMLDDPHIPAHPKPAFIVNSLID